MLNQDERREIDEAARHYPDRRAVCIEALKIVQRHRGGWVSDEALRDAALHVGVSIEEAEGVATFFNTIYRRPVGRHVILYCDSVSCWIMGCERLRDALARQLEISPGGTTADGRYTLLPNVCLGACDRAPAMMVGEDLHARVDPALVGDILDRYR